MKKFKFLVKYGLLKRIGRKSFIIANLVIAILSILIINLPSIIALFGGDDDQLTDIQIEVVNNIGSATLAVDLQNQFNLGLPSTFYYVTDIPTADVDAFWEDEEVDILMTFEGDLDDPVITLYSKFPEMNASMLNQVELQLISYQLGGTYERPLFQTVMAPDYEDPEAGMMVGSISSLLILPLFILVTMATQFVGVDIIEEKSTKAIETIIASVPSNTHFLSKIVASIFFVIIQGGLILFYGLIASLVSKLFQSAPMINLPQGEGSLLEYLGEILPNWPILLLMTVLFIIVGTLFYLVIAALFASMAVTQEDYQQFQSPLMLMLLGGFYIGIFAPLAGGEGFMKVMAFVPIFAPMVAPVAMAGGSMTILEGVIALIALIAFLAVMVYFASPVYKVAILNYDQTKFFKRIGDNFKKAFHRTKK
ncbi:MAG: ABC transporter permease [Acholeplasmataceae bacterium]|jgi:ABC-2 type transport system permease protein|nr:ABC transporter permease [Acholeplasmataceae bacterium]